MGETRGIYGTNLQTLKGFNNQRYLRLLVETLFYELAIITNPKLYLLPSSGRFRVGARNDVLFFYKYVPMASSLSTPIDVIPRKKHRGRLNLIQDLPELGNKYNYMDK